MFNPLQADAAPTATCLNQMTRSATLRIHSCHRLSNYACVSLLATVAVAAQSTTNAPALMEKTVVEGIPLDQTVLPMARPLGSVLGDDRNIIDTPRSVSIITRAQMEERNIARMTDIGQLSPGIYTPERYGLPGVPLIRGDLGELYQNGQRVQYSRNSILPSFNQVESLDVVKGPGSAVYGPQGQGPGGYVNFVTKQPYFDSFHAETTTKWGTYVPGGLSYFSPEWNLDFGGPVSEKLAYRVSYLGRESDSYYQNVKDNTQDFFAALTYRPNENWNFDWTGQFITSRFNEVSGINRVTQDLIDHRNYIAGPVQDISTIGLPISAVPVFGILNTNTAHVTRIYGNQTLNGPADDAQGQRFSSQLISTYRISDTAKIVNLSYGETMKTSKEETYGYTEYVPKNWMVDNRTELHYDFDAPGVKGEMPIKTISGTDFRYQRLLSYQDFSNEPFFIYDLTQPASLIVQPGVAPGAPIGGGLAIPGVPKQGGNTFPSSGNQDSDTYDGGFFTQWDLQLFEKFNVVVGGRGDYIDAHAASPEFVGKPTGSMYDAHESVLDSSVFVSGIYKWTPTLSSYVTYDVVNAITGGANFGGVDGTGGKDGLRRSLTGESVLLEAGTKASFFENKVYVAGAVFDQTRQRPNLVGPPTEVETGGIELESVYQPTRSFNVTGNATFQESYQVGNTYQQTFSYLDGYPVGYIVDGQSGTGYGSPNFESDHGRFKNPGRVPAASTPKILFNAYLTYVLDCGFGFSFGPRFEGSQWANQEGTLKLPAQYTLNGSIFYRRPKWEVQVNFFNITDQRNWTAIDPDFAGNDVIYPQLPFHISGQVKIKF